MNKFIISLLVCLFALNKINAQNNFYDRNTIQTIALYFPFADWDYRLDTAMAGTEAYILADSVVINGKRLDSVAVKYKGNSSYNPNNKKNSFHIALDTIQTNQDYQGYTDIKLNNGATDPSLIREVLGYYQLGNYMNAPKANFATVYVNNVWRGIYCNVESVNKKFIGENYYSKDGPFIKGNALTPNTSTLPNLVPNGWDSIVYYPTRYELKSDYGWTPFIEFMNNLNNNPSLMKTELDIDRTIWMHAFNNSLTNLDSYTGNFAQNYYLYKDNNNLWIPQVWDLNMCYGSFTNLGAGQNLNINGLQQMSINAQITNAARPLIANILSSATYKKMYVAHCKTILKESVLNNDYYTVGLAVQNLIKDSIAVDSLLFFTYQKFIDNLDTAVITTGNSQKIGIKQLVEGRNAYLNTTPEFMAVAPTINNVISNPTMPKLDSTFTITATINNADSVFIGYRYTASVPFSRVEMFDDGNHGDAAAGDNIFGAKIIASSGKIDYYLYAQNANAGIFSPERAEHEFHVVYADIAQVSTDKLVLNEIMPSNSITFFDANGQADDWIELKNKSNTAINLTGLYLSDEANNLSKWAFPSTASIAANNYLIVWADQDAYQSGLHASFKLSSGGDQLYLSYANGTIVDSVKYTSASPDIALGRCIDGVGNFGNVISATPNGTNLCLVGITDNGNKNAISIYPNPVSNLLHIQAHSAMDRIIIYNMMGKQVYSKSNIQNKNCNIDLSNLSSGLYIVNIDGRSVKVQHD